MIRHNAFLTLSLFCLAACGDDDPADVSADAGVDSSDFADTTDSATDASTTDADATGTDIGADTFPSSCGNGVIEGFEECDDGSANSDSTPDACREDCRAPWCGDEVVDSGEECDDGNGLSGDGCPALCREIEGSREREDNGRSSPQSIESGERIVGSLGAHDLDCYSIEVPANGYLEFEVSDGRDGCSGDTWVRVYRQSDGALVGSDDQSGVDACARVNPNTHEFARYMDADLYDVCVEGFFGVPVDGYVIDISTGFTCTPGVYVTPASEDLDGDRISDLCDDDDDNDGISDAGDNCPLHSNGRNGPEYRPDGNGYITNWLLLGGSGIDDENSMCTPSDVDHLGGEAEAAPEPGDDVNGVTWTEHLGTNPYIDLDALVPGVDSSEAYALAYLEVDTARRGELRFGTDDGFIVWLNGEIVGEGNACRGVVADGEIVDIILRRGVNTLLFKVRDGSGGWGLSARLWDTEMDQPMRDVVIALSQMAPRVPSQADTDGDGIGDACDPD